MAKKTIIHLNGKAVSLMETGKYQEAISLLSITIGSFKDVVEEIDTTQDHSEDCNLCILQSEIPQDFHRKEGEPFMYNQGTRILSSFDSDDIAQALLFNLALTYHLLSQKSQRKQPLLKKALVMYELSFHMQMKKPLRLSNNMYLSLALMNNVGLIHNELNDRDSASKWFHELLSLLMFSKQCGMCDDFSERCLEGFYDNALGSECQSMAAPAA
jgi:hypothetical protein